MHNDHNHHRTCFAVALLGIALFLAAGCKKKENTYVPPPPASVTVSKPLVQTVTNYAEFTGTTEAQQSVEIRPRVEGYLEKILFTPSSYVNKGDLLFVIDPRPYEAKLREAQAELMVRKAELDLAKATLIRKENAYKDRAVSEVDVIEARAKKEQAQAQVESAKASVETARLNLNYTHIKAPISGRIDRSLVDKGNLVGAGTPTLLATIVDDDPMYAYFTVSERDLLYYQEHCKTETFSLNTEQKAFLGLANQPDYPTQGHIDYIDNRLQSTSGTMQVRAVFDNANHWLLPGLFARIRVPLGQVEGALLIPDLALGVDQQGEYVLVVDKDNKVEYRSVTTGTLVHGMRVITKGIGPDDRVIVKGVQKARPGATVNPTEVKPDTLVKTSAPSEAA
ncbi:efflux RND transporter periplasmic adaptor subunit [Desulfoplanes formicivorans]|uniref:RND transporter n=1 Tax=Desulfoplanes formicivorans TaxID=1592317 RepID=A0A194AHQ2_9BACT|nr:efflux RND transporter periplasmic adaptor subunit [Desulfoplanes formicivorans]GAU08745.1 RND transporter [Desulfoplanes formicivorans]